MIVIDMFWESGEEEWRREWSGLQLDHAVVKPNHQSSRCQPIQVGVLKLVKVGFQSFLMEVLFSILRSRSRFPTGTSLSLHDPVQLQRLLVNESPSFPTLQMVWLDERLLGTLSSTRKSLYVVERQTALYHSATTLFGLAFVEELWVGGGQLYQLHHLS
jgi:hypothetical protein